MVRGLCLVLAVLLLGAESANAHVFGAEGAGFPQGFAHPFGGIDHLLAMVAVGLWAAQLGGYALWMVPISFVAVMTLGGAVGMAHTLLPHVELGVGISLLVLGVLVAAAVRGPTLVCALVVAIFALFHGHAHGTELPQAASEGGYAFGFMVATVILHAAGVGLGLLFREGRGQWVLRLGGATVAAMGIALVLGR